MSNEYILSDVPVEEVSASVLLDSPEITEPSAKLNEDIPGKAAFEKGDYKTAVTQLEAAAKEIKGNVNIIVMLAAAYKELGSYIKAIHWYKKAMRDYGMTDCQKPLMEIYRTGFVGQELKNIAEEYFSEQ